MSRLRRLLKHRRIVQFFEFLVGGSVYFWVGLGVFSVLYHVFDQGWLLAKICADVIGLTLSFLIQRYWAFYDKRLANQDLSVIIKFYFINGIDFIFDYGIVALVVSAGITPYVGFVVSAAYTTVWDYFWYRFWVFKA